MATFCSNCGTELSEFSSQCPSCNTSISKVNTPHVEVHVHERKNTSNGIGTAGLVLSIIAIFIGFIPILGWLIWFLGALFSFIGVFKPNKGKAIAGLIISFFGLFLLLLFVGGVLGTALATGL